MNLQSINSIDITPGMVCRDDYLSEGGELLLAKGVTVTATHVSMLERRNIFELYFRPAVHTATPAIDPAMQILFEADEVVAPAAIHSPASKVSPRSSPVNRAWLDNKISMLDLNLKKRLISDRPMGAPFIGKLHIVPPQGRSPDYKSRTVMAYRQALIDIRVLLTQLSQGVPVDNVLIRNQVDEFLKLFVTDRTILLNLVTLRIEVDHVDYVYHHSLNVCLLSLAIAVAAGYNREQVLLVGCGALLHDTGMLLIPEVIRAKDGPLSDAERGEMQKHPILILPFLDRFSHLPDPVLYIAYQTHERENGKGYPFQRRGDQVHRFAKIVQVADVYEAMTAPRKYRNPLTPYRAMEELIRMSHDGFFTIDFVRAFLKTMSLFPVGSIVELSDHRLAKVVQAGTGAIDRPVVMIVTNPSGRVLGPHEFSQLDLAGKPEVSIVNAYGPERIPEIGVMDGF